MFRKSVILAVICAFLLPGGSAGAATQAPPNYGCPGPEYQQFAFWIGDWDVFSGPNQVGTSRVERILNDCVIFENWTSASGNAGKSFNTYDPAKNDWHQTWVDNSGLRTEYHGGLVSGEMVVVATQLDAKGAKTLQRMTFTRLPGGKVRQHGESSADDGKTWTTSYDLTYVRHT